MTDEEELVYARGELSVDQLQAEIAQFWQELGNPGSSGLDSELRAAGLDRSAISDVDTQNAIAVRAGTSGADPNVVLIVVALAPSANRVIKDLWKTIVLPRIQRRWGEDAVGEEKRSQA
jgi:hypothetical protein